MGIIADHVERVQMAVLKRDSMATLARWIEEKTTIAGVPYSFKDHEYQERIVSDTSLEVNVQKPSQVGVSECTARLALGMVRVVQPLTAIYTLPTAKFAATFMRTRVDPIIQGSKALKAAIHKTNDNAELKQIGDSFLYLRGSASSNAPISIPADVIINDEMDFSDQEVLTQYQSRLTHSKWKMFKRFSTPTVPDYGINREFEGSRKHYNFCKCCHCNHFFIPDYYDHVQIPGYTGDLREITKVMLGKVRWEEAVLICPSCGKEPSLQVEHRQWVCQNPSGSAVASGIQVTPFDAPNIIRPKDLVRASTNYKRLQDFMNFSLGLPMADSEATLMKSDFMNNMVNAELSVSKVRVMGVDVGRQYHFVIGEPDGMSDDGMFVVHKESVPVGLARRRYMELKREFNVVLTVMDSQPHAETVMALQGEDHNLYASVYVKRKSLSTHTVVDKEDDPDEGRAFVRQVNVNRSRAFDGYMVALREGRIIVRRQGEEIDEAYVDQHTSMKRVRTYDQESDELEYTWQKTDGEDHFHHASVYCWIAAKIRGVSRSMAAFDLFGVGTYRQKY